MRSVIGFFLLTLCSIAIAEVTPPQATTDPAVQLYRKGILPDGSALQGTREGGVNINGEAAACANCHRRSGLGTTEGQIVIPPIIGRYLLNPLEKNIKDTSLPHVQNIRVKRSPYTDATLARAIREGVDSDGRQLNFLMPRFILNDEQMSTLIAYLKELTSKPQPGVTDDVLHFATIITPDADPELRKAMLEVMEKFIEDKNEFQHGGARRIQSNARAILYRVRRRWQLHVWDLTGEPATWQQQLKDKFKKEPVFAVISGLGGKTWEPVHRFCEAQAVPCLFPNVEMPVVAEKDFYNIYFSRGTYLEADLIAHDLLAHPQPDKKPHILQMFRQGDIGVKMADYLQNLPGIKDYKVFNHALPEKSSKGDIAKVFHHVKPDTIVVLWLRPEDLKDLPAEIKSSHAVYVSGTMGSLEHAPLSDAWKNVAKIVYPFDMPDLRLVRMNYPLGWFRIRHIKVINEKIQSDTYLACGIVSETLSDMLDSFIPDYLVERVEVMLSHRLITGYYPRLSLAPGQRFASKGGYIAHFLDAKSKKLKPDTEWIIP